MTTARFSAPLLALPRSAKRALALMVDASLCILSVWLAFGIDRDTVEEAQGLKN